MQLVEPISRRRDESTERDIGQQVVWRGAIVAIAVAFLCRLFAAAAIVPPWQGPDEPTHFALAKQLTRADGRDVAVVTAVEGEVLRSMRRHDWWRHYDRPTPNPFPSSFSDVPNDLFRGTLDQPAYYFVAAGVLRLLPESTTEQQYVALRALSAALAMLTMAFGWLGTRALWGEMTAAGTLAVVALHPQFLLSAISVNPDALINACGALVWWQVARLRDRSLSECMGALMLIVAACLVAVFSKRNGLPLVLVAALGGAAAARMPLRRGLSLAFLAVGTIVAVGAVLAAFSPAYGEFLHRLVTFWGAVFRIAPLDLSPRRLEQFAFAAVDTAWLTAGWLRFPPPEWWSWTVRTLTTLGIVGAVRLLRHRHQPATVAALFVGIHAGALLFVGLIAGSAPQGRYLFGVLFPASALFIGGLLQWFPPRARDTWALATIVAAIAILDFTGFLYVLLPAYAR
jgi:hypothetical protein